MDHIKDAIIDKFGKEAMPSFNNDCIEIDKKIFVSVVQYLHSDKNFYFDCLTCISGVDNPEINKMEVVYHLYSYPFETKCCLKVIIDRPEVDQLSETVPSLCGIFKSANWLEREVYDLYGIPFENHPDLRKILMPADWRGFPLRKDYTDPEKYHGVTIKYEETNE